MEQETVLKGVPESATPAGVQGSVTPPHPELVQMMALPPRGPGHSDRSRSPPGSAPGACPHPGAAAASDGDSAGRSGTAAGGRPLSGSQGAFVVALALAPAPGSSGGAGAAAGTGCDS